MWIGMRWNAGRASLYMRGLFSLSSIEVQVVLVKKSWKGFCKYWHKDGEGKWIG